MGRAEALARGHAQTQLEVADRAQDVADDTGAFGAGRGAGGHVERAGRGKHAVGGVFGCPSLRSWASKAMVASLQCLMHMEVTTVTLGKAACFNTAQLCQVHQFFAGFSVEPKLRKEAINDMWALKEMCREAFGCAKSAPSATQQQVCETLRHMGLSVKDEGRCPQSGYSIDMLARQPTGVGRRDQQQLAHLGSGG